MDVFIKIQKALHANITATKAGLNGFKPLPNGGYLNASDNAMESLKLLEDAITSCGCNTDEVTVASIGFNADTSPFYNEEQNKYDVEGPKNLFDPSMLADWYIKLCTEHPLSKSIISPSKPPPHPLNLPFSNLHRRPLLRNRRLPTPPPKTPRSQPPNHQIRPQKLPQRKPRNPQNLH